MCLHDVAQRNSVGPHVPQALCGLLPQGLKPRYIEYRPLNESLIIGLPPEICPTCHFIQTVSVNARHIEKNT